MEVIRHCDPRNTMHHLRKHPSSGYYHYRHQVPKALQPLYGKAEIIKSLRTKDPQEARILAYRLSAKLLTEFQQYKQAMSGDQLPDSIKRLLDNPAEAKKSVRQWQVSLPGGIEISTDPSAKDSTQEHRQALEALKAIQQANPQPVPEKPPETARDFISQLTGSQAKHFSQASAEYLEELEARQLKSLPHIATAINHFKKWLLKTDKNIAVNQVSPQHIKDYKQALRKAPNHKTGQKGLSEASIYKKLGFIETFFRWCQDQRYFPDGERNLPTYRLKGKKPNAVIAGTTYQPFTDQELKRIFNPDKYLARNKTPHQLLAPIIGAYTGARLAEICYINPQHITNNNPEGIYTLTFEKKTKNESSRRTIPIHSALEKPLLTYIEMLLKAYPNATNLFPYSSNPDKAAGGGFARYLDHIGITSKQKVFHSFRKNVAQQLKMAGCPTEYSQYYIGHLNKNLHNTVYAGMDKPLSLFKQQIDKIEMLINIAKYRANIGDLFQYLQIK